MEQQQLFDKYKEGKHWENHPTEYAERYSAFLKKQSFSGLLVDVGCGNGRDVAVFQRNGFNVIGVDCSKNSLTVPITKSISSFFIPGYIGRVSIFSDIFSVLGRSPSLQP